MKTIIAILLTLTALANPASAQDSREVDKRPSAYAPEDFHVKPIGRDTSCLVRKKYNLHEVSRTGNGKFVVIEVRQIAILPNRLCADRSQFEKHAAWWDALRASQNAASASR